MTRPVTEAIDWHEGMLLAPQHFQQLSLRQEELLHYHAAALAPFHWGVLQLEIDEAALTQGVLRVGRIEAVLPDGLIVSRGANDPEPLEVDLKLHAAALAAGACMIYLAVPARGPAPLDGEMARYRSVEGGPVIDESSGEGEVYIPRLRPRPVLLVAEAPAQRYAALPIARVRRSDEKLSLDEGYEPPALRAAPGSRFGRVAAQISERLRKKAEVLSDRARPQGVVQAPQLLETRLMIHSLVGALPRLEAVLAAGQAHPFELYLALCEVAGHAAVVGHGLVPPLFPAYDHADPMAAFRRVSDYILRVAGEGISESFSPFRFYYENGAYSVVFDELWRSLPLVLGVRGQTGMTEDEVEEWIAQSLIGSQGLVQDMRDKRILGARRTRTEGEGDLVPASGVLLFSLEPDPDFVQPNQVLQVWNVGDRGETPRVVEIVLYVKVPR
ncbi:MAG TPA: type VI secretion system baseplate subunit TssK [Thermoanaerobaculia bacterium]|nr:type VI secretion system baseplate subunit TssK [Thermoanaerobaculia bacterium]